jgi:hypothetical protein
MRNSIKHHSRFMGNQSQRLLATSGHYIKKIKSRKGKPR